MKYNSKTEWAKPYIEQLEAWMRQNRITLLHSQKGGGFRKEEWLLHPNATDEELLAMCIPYFTHCQDCEWSSHPHILIQSSENGYLHLCTKMAIAKGMVAQKDIP